MAKEPSAPPLSDVYTKVWNVCFKLWPLFLVQLVFTILQYAVLVLCLILLLGPFIGKYSSQIAGGLKHPNSFDWSPMATDWVGYFADPTWIAILVGLVLLYLTWWCLLSAISDGGVFATFWGYFQSDKSFSLKEFLRDGLRYMMPMIWLQVLLFALVMAVFMVWCFIILFGVGFCVLLSGHTGIIVLFCVLLGIPLFLFWIVFALLFAVYSFVCKACLTNGLSPWEAVKEAFHRFIEKRWRLAIGLIVAFLTYIVVSLVTRMVLGVLGMVPYIGFLFTLLDFFIGIGLAILLVVYLPGLSVALLSERET